MPPAGTELVPLVLLTLKLAEGETRVFTELVLLAKLASVDVGPAATLAVLTNNPLATVGTPRKVSVMKPPLGMVNVAVMLVAEVVIDVTLAPALTVGVKGAIKFTPVAKSVKLALKAALGPKLATVMV